jgi:hypothetical protein
MPMYGVVLLDSNGTTDVLLAGDPEVRWKKGRLYP